MDGLMIFLGMLVFMLVLLSGLPVAFGLGFLAILLLSTYVGPDKATDIAVEKAYSSIDSDLLVAVPLFILAAQLISATGMGKRLFNAAEVFLWRLRGGLGVATIGSSGIFSAMTGSSFISASTMGLVAIPELRRAGYGEAKIASAITAGGTLGSMIPPSIVMIVYGYLTDESISKLFMAGIIPGLLLITLYSAFMMYTGRAERIDKSEKPKQRKRVAVKEAFWGLMAPVIILGGIYLGIFTAPEAAAVAVVYCLLIGFLVYRSLTLKSLWEQLMAATVTSAMVTMIIIGGAILGHGVIYGRMPQEVLNAIVAVDMPPIVLLLIINLALFVLGMFLEVLALIYLVVPLLVPVIAYMEWDNIWIAVMLLINVNLALITPPMGGVLYVVSHIGNMPLGNVMKGAMMPIVALLLVLVLVLVFPQLALWLPSLT
ncbi:TRAP transporter large permease [Aestuariibacter salexigens]|uniref:TRAP transporter large permease n=1 Tax=Aestuariibacter salexigens TaxID=226010 RepID=UPI00040C8926|nr:TRAP transporter large permease [Aestuariibacter salexigens]